MHHRLMDTIVVEPYNTYLNQLKGNGLHFKTNSLQNEQKNSIILHLPYSPTEIIGIYNLGNGSGIFAFP